MSLWRLTCSILPYLFWTLVAKAFAAATVIIFGGATLTIGLAVSQLELHTVSDIFAVSWSLKLLIICEDYIVDISMNFSCVFQTDDIRTKGKDIIQPKFESIKEQMGPLRTWVC